MTGAGDGLGRSTALEFARYGATIILLGKTQKKLESVYDEIEQQGSPQAVIMPMDLEKAGEENYQQLASAIHENFKQLDGLVLNAAILGQHGPMDQMLASKPDSKLPVFKTLCRFAQSGGALSNCFCQRSGCASQPSILGRLRCN